MTEENQPENLRRLAIIYSVGFIISAASIGLVRSCYPPAEIFRGSPSRPAPTSSEEEVRAMLEEAHRIGVEISACDLEPEWRYLLEP